MRDFEQIFLHPSYVHVRIFTADFLSGTKSNFFYHFRRFYIKMKLFQDHRYQK
jgi:hypothetical protein